MTTNIKNKKVTPKKTLKQKSVSILKSVLVYGSIFFVIYTAVNWWRQPVMPANPQLQLTDYKGQNIDLAAMSQDKPTLVYFWGTWCSICSITSPAINELANENNYPVVSIAIKSGSDQELHNYLNDHGYSFTTVNDQHSEIFTDWQGQVTPSYIILKDNKMTQGLTGIQPLWSLKLRLWLSSTL
ncbi:MULTISPECIES: protein disulfide oxidoreductase [Pseudoalteromonas]|uniref:Alkyl hydroperoxide reductase n=1 Tax=Pseudoalteromonas fuliginea TaxID=1872678 RepID=A0ABD3Y9H1_9GAMM|nr:MULTISPECIES: protein disulfide oxidoreductase [Pseudoalteromonas]ALQ07182.1 alkyl hydroperoxide reductase [Pseudoalteromonas sp. Bsw20308]KDC51245.1 alkyl hydroperoxide reductase [Pseudoalteromonas fuliginea]KJZ28619.1 alkyl hydroperoxide reductase [Pseudoalteromonas fuliginea]